MNKTAKWIWYPGDFELYHHLLLSCRRQEKGCDYPCMWHLSLPEKSVAFHKSFEAKTDTKITVVTHSKGMIRLNEVKYPVNTEITLKAGQYSALVELYDIEKFPSFYLNSEYVMSDENWQSEAQDRCLIPAACTPAFVNPNDDPSVFPFCYTPLMPVSTREINGGTLYDFGKETFGAVTVTADSLQDIKLTYGESCEEALDYENAIIRETLTEKDEKKRPCRAFRYLFVKAPLKREVKISAEYQYLPLTERSSFNCHEEQIKKIWEVCAYTFRLNSREFFLDGIKRDRWVWSGDAYQSFMINRYLFNDNGLTERTIRALLGKPPYKMHINRINDYSAYLIFSVWEHYFHTGNLDFVKEIYPNLKALYEFIVSRLDEKGYVVPLMYDWIFIDWGELDKTGAHCFEQILLWRVYGIMAKLSALMNEPDVYTQKAEALKKNILADYWDAQKGAFIDSFSSGKRFVSRQTNVSAVLYDFANEAQTQSIVKNVFENESLPAIKTPYFKLYELLAFCKVGKIEEAQEYISSYWGGMLRLGATTVWEEFDPTKKGAEHYAMYGEKYGKSLCHAWGSGPILLLTRYIAGVEITSVGGKTYRVAPHPGKYRSFTAEVPVNNGTVRVSYQNGTVTVKTDVPGGTLEFNGKSTEIPVTL